MTFAGLSTDSITAAAVLPLLRDSADPEAPWLAGEPYRYLPDCPSTNTVLKQIADVSPTGTLVITDDQTAGKGRLGRTWLGIPGRDLAFSVLLRPRLDASRGHLLALAAGLAVAEVLEGSGPRAGLPAGLPAGLRGQVGLKWPNDVLLAGRKVCGILIEASAGTEGISWAVAGVGINVNGGPGSELTSLPPALAAEWEGRPRPISLAEHLGRSVPRAPLLAALLDRLTRRWSALDSPDSVPELLAAWRERDALVGRPVEVFAGADRSELVATGRAAGIGAEGQLLVRVADGAADGLLEVFAGDVSVTMP